MDMNETTHDSYASRRWFLAATPLLALAGGDANASVTTKTGAEGTQPSTVVNVGPHRTFLSLQAAMSSIVDSSASKPYVIVVDPGVYSLTAGGGAVQLKPFVAIVGTERLSTVLLTTDRVNLRANSNSRIANLSIFHDGQDPKAGAIECSVPKIREFFLESISITVNGAGAAFVSDTWVELAHISDVSILTSASGIVVSAGGRFYIDDCDIQLYGNKGNHIGISANGSCRIYFFGGKISTGYGYPEVTDVTQSVIGVMTQPTFEGRIELRSVWSICRNDGAGIGVHVACVMITGPRGYVRVFGGYLQAENPSGLGGHQTICNLGLGRVEVYGSRVKDYGDGPIYGANQIGRRLLTAADDNILLDFSSGGVVVLDATLGPFRVKLNPVPIETEQFIFKKIDSTTNAIEISAGSRKIDGSTSVYLSRPYDRLHVRYCYGQFLIVG